MSLSREVCLDPSNIVLDGDPAPLPKEGGRAPNFRHMSVLAKRLVGSRCNLAWVGLGPGHIVLDGTQPLPKNGGTVPNFRPMSVVAKRLDGSRCLLVRR